MKKLFKIIFFTILLYYFFGFNKLSVQAFSRFDTDTGLLDTGNSAGYIGLEATGRTPAETAGLFIGILLGFIGVIFLGLIIYGGFTWMMARGNQAEVDKAKRMIESAVIGLIVVLAAYAITFFVGQALAPAA